MKNRIKKYWQRKSTWNKFSDFIFILFVVALLFPQGRMAIGGFVNQIKAKFNNPSTITTSERVIASNLNWKLMGINGEKVNLENYKGKVIFINNWATWCPPCVGEMPEIQKLYNVYKDNEQVKFLMISNENGSKINSFIDKKGYTFPVYSSLSEGPSVFQSRSIPTTFILSKSGEIVVKESGAANWGGIKMQKLITNLINE